MTFTVRVRGSLLRRVVVVVVYRSFYNRARDHFSEEEECRQAGWACNGHAVTAS